MKSFRRIEIQPRSASPRAEPLAPVLPGSTADFREVLQLAGGGPSGGDFAEAPVFSGRADVLLRGLLKRYGFERAPASWSELLGLCEYCDSLDAASGLGMRAQDRLSEWQQASFEVWRRKAPQLMPAIELFCAGELDALRALHSREDTLGRLGRHYLEPEG